MLDITLTKLKLKTYAFKFIQEPQYADSSLGFGADALRFGVVGAKSDTEIFECSS